MTKQGIERVGSKCRNAVEIIIFKAKYVFSEGACNDSPKQNIHVRKVKNKEMVDHEKLENRINEDYFDFEKDEPSTSKEIVNGNSPTI